MKRTIVAKQESQNKFIRSNPINIWYIILPYICDGSNAGILARVNKTFYTIINTNDFYCNTFALNQLPSFKVFLTLVKIKPNELTMPLLFKAIPELLNLDQIYIDNDIQQLWRLNIVSICLHGCPKNIHDNIYKTFMRFYKNKTPNLAWFCALNFGQYLAKYLRFANDEINPFAPSRYTLLAAGPCKMIPKITNDILLNLITNHINLQLLIQELWVQTEDKLALIKTIKQLKINNASLNTLLFIELENYFTQTTNLYKPTSYNYMEAAELSNLAHTIIKLIKLIKTDINLNLIKLFYIKNFNHINYLNKYNILLLQFFYQLDQDQYKLATKNLYFTYYSTSPKTVNFMRSSFTLRCKLATSPSFIHKVDFETKQQSQLIVNTYGFSSKYKESFVSEYIEHLLYYQHNDIVQNVMQQQPLGIILNFNKININAYYLYFNLISLRHDINSVVLVDIESRIKLLQFYHQLDQNQVKNPKHWQNRFLKHEYKYCQLELALFIKRIKLFLIAQL